MPNPKYHRLPGRRTHLFANDSLWTCDDHILVVRSNGYTERYYRYYFNDIQGFLVKPSPRSKRITISLGLPLLLLAAIIGSHFAKAVALEWAIFCAVLATPLVVALIVNWIKGATCDTFVCTAVADVLLTPLARKRSAFRSLSRIAASILTVQQPVSAEQLGLSTDSSASTASLLAGSKPSTVAKRSIVSKFNRAVAKHDSENSLPESSERMLWFLAVSEVLLALAATALLGFGGSMTRSLLYFVTLVLALLMASLTLARRRANARRPRMAALIHALVMGMGSYVAFYATTITRSLSRPKTPAGLEATGLIEPSSPVTYVLLWLSLLGALSIATWCVLSHVNRRTPER